MDSTGIDLAAIPRARGAVGRGAVFDKPASQLVLRETSNWAHLARHVKPTNRRPISQAATLAHQLVSLLQTLVSRLSFEQTCIMHIWNTSKLRRTPQRLVAWWTQRMKVCVDFSETFLVFSISNDFKRFTRERDVIHISWTFPPRISWCSPL